METVTRREAVAARAAVDRFEALVAEVREPLLRFLLRRTTREAAADVLADTLLVLWRRLDDVPGDASLPWSYAVARGCLANHERGITRQRRLVERIVLIDPPAESTAPPGDATDPDLVAALDRLPESDREILQMWAWERLEPREIAVTLGISANAATVRLHRAKRKLGEALKGSDGIRTQPGQGKEL